MAITRDEALQRGLDLLTSRIRGSLDVVDSMPGTYYYPGIDIEESWIIPVGPVMPMMLDGSYRYITVNKRTGQMFEIPAN